MINRTMHTLTGIGGKLVAQQMIEHIRGADTQRNAIQIDQRGIGQQMQIGIRSAQCVRWCGVNGSCQCILVAADQQHCGVAATNGGVPNYNKIKKSHEDYDKFVDIVKNIVDTHKSTPDKVDTFSDFIKSYMKRWPERLQDEAINHMTNYVIVKNMEHSMGGGGPGGGLHNPEGVNNRQ